MSVRMPMGMPVYTSIRHVYTQAKPTAGSTKPGGTVNKKEDAVWTCHSYVGHNITNLGHNYTGQQEGRCSQEEDRRGRTKGRGCMMHDA